MNPTKESITNEDGGEDLEPFYQVLYPKADYKLENKKEKESIINHGKLLPIQE